MMKKILAFLLMVLPMAALAQKVAVFNSNDVLKDYPAAKTVQSELEALAKQYEGDLQAMQKEFQTKLEKYQQEVNEKTPENIRKRREQELQDLQQRAQQSVQDNEQAFRQAQQTKMQPIIEAVNKALQAVLQEGGYVYAIDKVSANGITINEALATDITAAIKTKLNIK